MMIDQVAIEKIVGEIVGKQLAKLARRPPPVPRTWLSSQESAAYLGISEQNLSGRVKAGTAPKSYLIGTKSRRFKIADLDAWIEAHR